MPERKERLEEIIESLKQQRDELKLKMHLGSLEAREEWDALEKKWERWTAEAKAQSKPLREVMEDSAKDVGTALEGVLDEVKKSYTRIKNQLSSEKK